MRTSTASRGQRRAAQAPAAAVQPVVPVACRPTSSRPVSGQCPAARSPIPAPAAASAPQQLQQQQRAGVVARAMRADAQAEQLDAATLRLIADVTKQVDDSVASTVFSNNETARKAEFAPTGELRTKVMAGLRKLSKGLLERDAEVSRMHAHARVCVWETGSGAFALRDTMWWWGQA